jgi:hypothetical protein
MNPWSAPQWVRAVHRANEVAYFFGYSRPAKAAVANLQRPEEPKRLSLPRQYRLRLHYDNGRSTVDPRLRQPGPEESIRLGQTRPLDR